MEKKYLVPIDIITDVSLVEETLTRIGLPDIAKKIVYQTCHIIENQETNKNHIIHFKEYFGINTGDMKNIKMNDDDFKRRNTIIYLLNEWGLIGYSKEIKEYIENNRSMNKLFVLPYQKKPDWNLKTKVNIKNIKE